MLAQRLLDRGPGWSRWKAFATKAIYPLWTAPKPGPCWWEYVSGSPVRTTVNPPPPPLRSHPDTSSPVLTPNNFSSCSSCLFPKSGSRKRANSQHINPGKYLSISFPPYLVVWYNVSWCEQSGCKLSRSHVVCETRAISLLFQGDRKVRGSRMKHYVFILGCSLLKRGPLKGQGLHIHISLSPKLGTD